MPGEYMLLCRQPRGVTLSESAAAGAVAVRRSGSSLVVGQRPSHLGDKEVHSGGAGVERAAGSKVLACIRCVRNARLASGILLAALKHSCLTVLAVGVAVGEDAAVGPGLGGGGEGGVPGEGAGPAAQQPAMSCGAEQQVRARARQGGRPSPAAAAPHPVRALAALWAARVAAMSGQAPPVAGPPARAGGCKT